MKTAHFPLLSILLTLIMAGCNSSSSSNAQKVASDLHLESILQLNNETLNKTAILTEHKIEKAVIDGGRRASDMQILDKALHIRKETAEFIQFTTSLREALISATGGIDQNTMYYKGVNDILNTKETLFGNTMLAKKLKGEANKMIDDINKVTNNGARKLPYIALDAKDDPRITDASLKSKSFEELNFSGVTLTEALLAIERLNCEALYLSKIALEELAAEVGASDLFMATNNIQVLLTPEKTIVKAGEKYKATLQLINVLDYSGVRYQLDDQRLIQTQNGGKIEITANSDQFDKDGISKKTFKYSATLRFKGKDTTFVGNAEYYVLKP